MLTRFFLPVAANAALMMLSHAVNSAGLGRATNATNALASYALAQAMVAFFEAPVLMLRQTTIALVRGRADMRLLIRLTCLLTATLLVVHLTVAATPIGRIILHRVVGAPQNLWQSTLTALMFLAPLPFISGIRSIYQGILLYQRQPTVITVAMSARVLMMAAVVTLLTKFVPHWGSIIGPITFMAGLGIEAFICIMYGRTTTLAAAAQSDDQDRLDVKTIVAFSLPLVVLGLVDGVATGAIAASLARTAHPDAAMAAYAVTWSRVAVLIGALQTIHQVILIFGNEPGVQSALRRFLAGVSGTGVLILAALAFTPVGRWSFAHLFGVPAELATESARSLAWFVPLPILVTISDTYVGRLLALRSSRVVAIAKVANMLMLISAALLSSIWAREAGAAAGPLMVLTAGFVEVTVLAASLLWLQRRSQRRRQIQSTAL
jgi:hypothetical protein